MSAARTNKQAMSWSTAWRIARRDLNARCRGLRLLLVCLFLGTGALAAIGTLTAAIERELEANGRQFLGGDLQIELWQRGLNEEESAALAEYGTVSAGTRMQAMARYGEQAAPIELKAIDGAYPLYGELVLEDGRSVGQPDADEAWLSPGAAERLGVSSGRRSRSDRNGHGRRADRGRTRPAGRRFPARPDDHRDRRPAGRAGLIAPGSCRSKPAFISTVRKMPRTCAVSKSAS